MKATRPLSDFKNYTEFFDSLVGDIYEATFVFPADGPEHDADRRLGINETLRWTWDHMELGWTKEQLMKKDILRTLPCCKLHSSMKLETSLAVSQRLCSACFDALRPVVVVHREED